MTATRHSCAMTLERCYERAFRSAELAKLPQRQPATASEGTVPKPGEVGLDPGCPHPDQLDQQLLRQQWRRSRPGGAVRASSWEKELMRGVGEGCSCVQRGE
eukprot:6222-Heterococcus_DN1.PRE.1